MISALRYRIAIRWLPALLIAALAATMITVATPDRALAVSASELELAMTNLVNQSRVAAGLKALRTDSDLAAIAGIRATRMRDANVMSHTIGGNLRSQIDAYDVDWYAFGENVAFTEWPWGSKAVGNIHSMWMASPGHRALILSSKFNYVGVGLSYRSSNGRTFAALIFSESPDQTSARASMSSVSRSGDDVTWAWSGYDPVLQTHGAGLRDFDVQYRINSGAWTTLRDNTTSRSLTLPDRVSQRSYGLRVRATDRRGNVGPWTGESRIWVP